MARLLTNCLGRPPGCHGIYYHDDPCTPVCHGPLLHVEGPGIRDRSQNHVKMELELEARIISQN